MKKTTTLSALLVTLCALLPFTATAAPDVVGALDQKYKYDEANDSSLLKDYNGEPWWGMLANCAGYYTAASETEGVPAEVSAALRKQANFYATVASFRLAKDRGLGKTIHQPVISIAESATENALTHGLVSTPARQQSMRTLCGAHLNAYERMVPGMELQ